jgi:hypothetical protein
LVPDNERTCFIFKSGVTYEQKQLIAEAQQFIALFERIEERLARFTVNSELGQVQAFNNEVYQAAAAIWSYKRKVLGKFVQIIILY